MSDWHIKDPEAARLLTLSVHGTDPNIPYLGPIARGNQQRRIDRTARTQPAEPARVTDPADPRVGGRGANIPTVQIPGANVANFMRGVDAARAAGDLQLVAAIEDAVLALGNEVATLPRHESGGSNPSDFDWRAFGPDARPGLGDSGLAPSPGSIGRTSFVSTGSEIIDPWNPSGSGADEIVDPWGPGDSGTAAGTTASGPDPLTEEAFDADMEANITSHPGLTPPAGGGQREPGMLGDSTFHTSLKESREFGNYFPGYSSDDGRWWFRTGSGGGGTLGGDDDSPTGSAELAARLLPGYLHQQGAIRAARPSRVTPGANYGPLGERGPTKAGPSVQVGGTADEPEARRADPAVLAATAVRFRRTPGPGGDPWRPAAVAALQGSEGSLAQRLATKGRF